ncbi:unnamed protein product [Cylindrotheca closterium]|uniref:CS domain-containing protein n=1 Tax=Cylindrotheca closterium TaxID=2856 RepID=A0AAD2GAF3_9STRA|nr:unnamed protein product [Cylindrotheca closterium]
MSDNTFTYVKIPVNSEEPIEELSASKSGGLEKDALVKNAKAYFQQQSNSDQPSCEIMALSIPLPGNQYRAVSLYSSDLPGASTKENERATKLVTACGHSLPKAICGDVFIGRAYDNEEFEWERVDFRASDASPTAAWCRVARQKGGGGGQGGSASSLNSLVQQQMNVSGGPPHVVAPQTQALYGMDGAPAVVEDWGSWTQSADEVEAKLSIPSGTKSKDCKISFKRNQLSVAVHGETKISGILFSAIVPDDCTFTMEDAKDGTRDLCITLTKANEGSTWSFLTETA